MALIEVKVNREGSLTAGWRHVVRWINGGFHALLAAGFLILALLVLLTSNTGQGTAVEYLVIGGVTLVYGVSIFRGNRAALYYGIVEDVIVCAVCGYLYFANASGTALSIGLFRAVDLWSLWYARPTFGENS